MIIVDVEDKCKIMKRYAELIRKYHVTRKPDILHIVENDKVINKIIKTSYENKGISLLESQRISALKRLVDKCVKSIKNNDLECLCLSKEDIESINSIKMKKATFSRSKLSYPEYNRQIVIGIIENIYKEYGSEKFNKKTRPLLYELIYQRYLKQTSKPLNITVRQLSKVVSYTGLFRVENCVNSKIRKYIAEKYNKGVRLFYSDIVSRETNLRNDISLIRRSISMDEFPGIVIMRTLDYKLSEKQIEVLKEDNFKRISTELIVDVKRALPHASFSQISYIISENYYDVFRERYEGEDMVRIKRKIRHRIQDRKRSTKYVEYMKHAYDVDVLLW